jgi:hypothetical protein
MYRWQHLDNIIAQGKKILMRIFGEEIFKYELHVAGAIEREGL